MARKAKVNPFGTFKATVSGPAKQKTSMAELIDSEFVSAMADHIAFLQCKHGHFILEIGYAELTILLAQLHLALRHPNNTGNSARTTRTIVSDIIQKLEHASPGMGKLLLIGDQIETKKEAPHV